MMMFVLVVTGCRQNSADREEAFNSLMDENAIIVEKIESLSNKVSSLETSKEILLELIDEQVTILSGELNEADYTTLPIYHLDINTYEPRIQYYVLIKKDWSLEQKVKVLADKLSRYSFDGLPIDLVTIESLDDGRKIAIINLIDPEERIKAGLRRTWAGNYFQGSSGGNVTRVKLLRTFLQEDFKEEWVDGVKFLYNHDVTNNFEHVGELLGVTYLSYGDPLIYED